MMNTRLRLPTPVRYVLEWLKSIALALLVWSVLRTFVVEAFRIPSGSMQNTLLIGDFLFVNKFLYGAEVPLLNSHLPAVREPARGDIIVFDSVEDPDMKIVKRLIGVGGDTLEMREGTVYLNGAPQVEPYATPSDLAVSADPLQRSRMGRWQREYYIGGPSREYHPDLHDWGPIVVPHDSLFVMGDNRDDSYDSRYWGFLPRKSVRGRPLMVYFSIDLGEQKPLLSEVRWGRLFHAPR